MGFNKRRITNLEKAAKDEEERIAHAIRRRLHSSKPKSHNRHTKEEDAAIKQISRDTRDEKDNREFPDENYEKQISDVKKKKEAASKEKEVPPKGPTRRLTIAAFAPEVDTSAGTSAKMVGCWLSWMAHMMAQDPTTHYTLHVVRSAITAKAKADDAARKRAHRGRLGLLDALASEGSTDPILLTDVGVLPLRPYSSLLGGLNRTDILFLRSPSPHLLRADGKASTAVFSNAGFFNTGFILLRPVPPVRAWIAKLPSSGRTRSGGPPAPEAMPLPMSIPVSQTRRIPPKSRPKLRWGFFNASKVSAGWGNGWGLRHSNVTKRTVAIHPVGPRRVWANRSKRERANALISELQLKLPACED
jgi:hypothetical protein